MSSLKLNLKANRFKLRANNILVQLSIISTMETRAQRKRREESAQERPPKNEHVNCTIQIRQCKILLVKLSQKDLLNHGVVSIF